MTLNGNDAINRLMKIDLNLLVVLNALQETGSTIAAAQMVGRTQSAVSLSLGRLRDLFSDPLFVRAGVGLKPTKLCLELREPVQFILSEVLQLVDVGYGFKPEESYREAVFAFPEIAFPQALALKKAVEEAAPGVVLDLVGVDLKTADYSSGLEDLMSGKTDLMLSFYRNNAPAGIDILPLKSQGWVTLAREDHPIECTPSPEQWCSYEHVQVKSGSSGRNPIGDALILLGLERKVSLRTNNFLQALIAVSQSDLLLTTMTPVVDLVAKQLRLKCIEMPIAIPDVPMGIMVRHRKYNPFSAWLSDMAMKTFMEAH